MTVRERICAAAVVLGSLIVVEPAAACTCVGGPGEIAWPSLDQAAQESDAVVVGRVLAQTTLGDPLPYEGNNVAHVDLEVVEGIKGPAAGAHIRVWDSGFGSSCTHDLRPLQPGTLVALAMDRNRPEYREYQEVMRLKVAPGDYLLPSCGDFMQPVGSDRQAGEVAARLREAIRASPKGRRTKR